MFCSLSIAPAYTDVIEQQYTDVTRQSNNDVTQQSESPDTTRQISTFSSRYRTYGSYAVSIKHYTNMPMQYTAIFHGCKIDNYQMIFLKYFFLFLIKT